MRFADLHSIYWSTTTYPNATDAYGLHFNSTNVFPSAYSYRSYGFSVHYITKSPSNNTAASPLYYVRGGYIDLSNGALRGSGNNSTYWSNTTYPNATVAYYLGFGSTNLFLLYYGYRFNSFSVGNAIPTHTTSPLYYVRGGGILLNTGSLRYTGYASLYWSTTIYPNTTDAYNLHFNNTNIVPSDYSNRFHGFSVRFYAADTLI